MDIQTYTLDKKALVSSYITDFLKRDQIQLYSAINRWGNDAINRLLPFTLNGKLLRSSLLFLAVESFSKRDYQDITVKTASAIELFQTGLLIHDDIMDRDESRRGIDSMHIQYKKIFEQGGDKKAGRTGESFALLVGDMSFSLAFQILSTIDTSDLSQKLIALIASELGTVCVAQMQDTYGGGTEKQLTNDEILSVYAYKTGRYSIGLPLVAGGIIAGVDEQTIKKLWKMGTTLGILYQIKDDWLNIFGDPQKTGKPVGSDIREGKQTLYYYFLMEKSTGDNKKELLQLFGDPNLSDKDIATIKKQVIDFQIDVNIHAIVEKQEKIADEIIAHLPITEDDRKKLRNFILYLKKRDA